MRGNGTVTVCTMGADREGGGGERLWMLLSDGLYRDRRDLPGEEEQYAHYRRAVEGGEGTAIRALSLGAESGAACLGLRGEENPALGFRAIRLCLTRRALFREQLRAILRAGAWGPAAVLLPMVNSVGEVREARELLEECRREVLARGQVPGQVEVGVLVETPAAALTAGELAWEADFLVLDTGSLTQYTLAADRSDPRLSRLWDPCHPAVLGMVRAAAEGARRRGRPVGACGALAGRERLVETLVSAGVDRLAVPPEELPALVALLARM